VTDPAQKTQLDAMMGLLNRFAMSVLEAPESQRELMYDDIHKSLVETLTTLKMAPDIVEQKACELMEMLRALVRHIESGGGARGGHA
jgi:hypothetical protein